MTSEIKCHGCDRIISQVTGKEQGGYCSDCFDPTPDENAKVCLTIYGGACDPLPIIEAWNRRYRSVHTHAYEIEIFTGPNAEEAFNAVIAFAEECDAAGLHEIFLENLKHNGTGMILEFVGYHFSHDVTIPVEFLHVLSQFYIEISLHESAIRPPG